MPREVWTPKNWSNERWAANVFPGQPFEYSSKPRSMHPLRPKRLLWMFGYVRLTHCLGSARSGWVQSIRVGRWEICKETETRSVDGALNHEFTALFTNIHQMVLSPRCTSRRNGRPSLLGSARLRATLLPCRYLEFQL